MSDLLPSSTANTLTNPTGLSLLLAKPTIFSHETIVPIIGAVQTVTGCLISHLLCLDRTFINVPAGLHMAGTMVAILAAPFVTEARQRSAGMLLGILLSTAGCLLSAAAVWRGDFLLYCAAAIPAGLSNGVLHSLRSAATRRVASSGHAWLPAMGLATGLMAAVAAPHLVKLSREMQTPSLLHVTYLLFALLPALNTALMGCAGLSTAQGALPMATRSRKRIRQASIIHAVAAAMASPARLNCPMTGPPAAGVRYGRVAGGAVTASWPLGPAQCPPGFLARPLPLQLVPDDTARVGAVHRIVAAVRRDRCQETIAAPP